ncbi:MAG: ribosomal protein S18-alanine N-acetyltransferase [Terriglobales bacterium]
MSLSLAIRVAGFDDVAAVIALERQTAGAAHWTAEQYRKLVGSGVVLVAEEAGRLCGFIGAQVVAREWEIENVMVAAELARRGIGTELVGALIERARSKAVAAILLEVRESNVAARGLYEKRGFREVGRRRTYYADPVEDAILYALGFDR